ncbi:MAG: hypothetical protein HC802_16655 [Caldilineaceae bacterium]|nr:hypothetical protein [Caldilineaceae bacterium]
MADTYPIEQRASPPLPFAGPNILGRGERSVSPTAAIDALMACLVEGKMAYGLALENSNARNAASVDGCRIGRVERGSLLRIEAIFAANGEQPLTNLEGVVLQPAEVRRLGFVEDIQPIFVRRCYVCHSGVAASAGLQIIDYAALMTGSVNGSVITPGDPGESELWRQVSQRRMPMAGALPDDERDLIRAWIEAGAPEQRPVEAGGLWLQAVIDDLELADNPDCADEPARQHAWIASELVYPAGCGVTPDSRAVAALLQRFPSDAEPKLSEPSSPARPEAIATASEAVPVSPVDAATAGAANPAGPPIEPGATPIQVAALGIAPPSPGDGWVMPASGFCIEQRLADNDRGISALTFAPDGRLFMALDSPVAGEDVDPLILYDAYHPSRSISVYDTVAANRPEEILAESPRITGLDYHGGAVYVSRAGEVGRIVDGGSYEALAGGFAVNSQLFHANNGIAVVDGFAVHARRPNFDEATRWIMAEDADRMRLVLGLVEDWEGVGR